MYIWCMINRIPWLLLGDQQIFQEDGGVALAPCEAQMAARALTEF